MGNFRLDGCERVEPPDKQRRSLSPSINSDDWSNTFFFQDKKTVLRRFYDLLPACDCLGCDPGLGRDNRTSCKHLVLDFNNQPDPEGDKAVGEVIMNTFQKCVCGLHSSAGPLPTLAKHASRKTCMPGPGSIRSHMVGKASSIRNSGVIVQRPFVLDTSCISMRHERRSIWKPWSSYKSNTDDSLPSLAHRSTGIGSWFGGSGEKQEANHRPPTEVRQAHDP
jgi:hypothetical protein